MKQRRTLREVLKLRASRRAFVDKVRTEIRTLRAAVDRLSLEKSLFTSYLSQMDAHAPRHMPHNDARKIAALHSPGYVDALQLVETRAKQTLEDAEGAVAGSVHYTTDALSTRASGVQDDVRAALEQIKKTTGELVINKRIVRRYTGFFWRLQMLFRRRFGRWPRTTAL